MNEFIYLRSNKRTNRWIYIPEGRRYSTEAIDEYLQTANVVLYEGECPVDAHKHLSRGIINNIRGIIVRLGINITTSYLKYFRGLEFIGSPTTGITHFQASILEKGKYQIFTLRDCKENIRGITSTGEHTLALMLCLIRNVHRYHSSVINSGIWNRELYIGNQLSDQRLGIIGFGRIGKQLANACRALSMQVLFYDIDNSIRGNQSEGVIRTDLNDLLGSCDIISINASYEHGDMPIINTKNKDLIRKGSYIINTARGELIDENVIAEMIKSKTIKGFATDVINQEDQWQDNISENPLVKLAAEGYNILITPHIAGCTIDAMQKTELVLAKYITKQIRD